MSTIRFKVQQNRLKCGLSATQLADRIGASQSFISNIENGRKKPSVDTLCRIANVLNCDICDLVEYKQPVTEGR